MANSVDPDQTTFSDTFFFLGALRVKGLSACFVVFFVTMKTF